MLKYLAPQGYNTIALKKYIPLTITVTPLSQEEADALRVVLLDNGVKPGEVFLGDSQSTLEKVQQQLTETGHKGLATNIRDKINKGTSFHNHVTGSRPD